MMSTAQCSEIRGTATSRRKLPLDAIDVATCLWISSDCTLKALCTASEKMNRHGVNNLNLSVIIPTHNRAGMICRAIDSVTSQLTVDDEIIVIDDGSTDGTEELLNKVRDRIISVSYTHLRAHETDSYLV